MASAMKNTAMTGEDDDLKAGPTASAAGDKAGVSDVDGDQTEELEWSESFEIEERRANIQLWMEKLAKVKREEFEREEAALVPLRHYLMAHVVPTLTKGLIEVVRARPDDPVEFLAEFLFSNNPGSLNTTLGDNFPKDEPKKKSSKKDC